MPSTLSLSSRKPVLTFLAFAFLIMSLYVFMSRQELVLKAIADMKQAGSPRAGSKGHQKYSHVNDNIISPLLSMTSLSSSSLVGAEQNTRGTPKKFKDVIDNSGASRFLSEYERRFAAKGWKGPKADPNKVESIKEWWQAAAMIDWYINSPIRHKCRPKVAYGNWHVCQDAQYEVKPPCLVYSFGINWDYSFDDAMGKLGCEVHSFDPSMGVEDHHRNPNVTFHNLGLGSINTDGYLPRNDMYVDGRKLWRVRTVRRIKEMLGHTGRVIDVFKMDVEGYEWNVIDNMMETGMFDYIRQYMLEFHLFPDYPLKEDYVNIYNIYHRLREMGMREFGVAPHPKTLKVKEFNNQGDSQFVNVNFGRH